MEGGNRSGVSLGERRRRKGSNGGGIEFELNGRQLAVFYIRNKLYCIDEKCPHAGKESEREREGVKVTYCRLAKCINMYM